jgi:hypothetical protein
VTEEQCQNLLANAMLALLARDESGDAKAVELGLKDSFRNLARTLAHDQVDRPDSAEARRLLTDPVPFHIALRAVSAETHRAKRDREAPERNKLVRAMLELAPEVCEGKLKLLSVAICGLRGWEPESVNYETLKDARRFWRDNHRSTTNQA